MNRRDLVRGLALSPLAAKAALAAGSAAPTQFAKDKVTAVTVDGIEVFSVRANSKPKVLYGHNWVVVRMKTDRGLTGLGEASQSGDDVAMLNYLKKFSALLQGRSIFDIEWFLAAAAQMSAGGDELNRVAASCAANSLEHCLWDIRGKLFGVPCYEFFGGALRPELRQYANINRSTPERTPEGFAKMASSAIASGLTAVKLAAFDEIPLGNKDHAVAERMVQIGLDRAGAVRKAIGANTTLMVDVHSRLTLDEGLDLVKRLEPLNLYWVEEVTPPDTLPAGRNAREVGETYSSLAAIHRAAGAMPTRLNTAGGEDLNGVRGFFPYIAADAATIYMPDVKRCGGMLEMKKISGIVEGASRESSPRFCSPHGPAGPVGNVIAAQVMVTSPNFNILEMSYGENPWRAELISPPEDLSSGSLRLSKSPGHGITLNETVAAKYAAQNPF